MLQGNKIIIFLAKFHLFYLFYSGSSLFPKKRIYYVTIKQLRLKNLQIKKDFKKMIPTRWRTLLNFLWLLFYYSLVCFLPFFVIIKQLKLHRWCMEPQYVWDFRHLIIKYRNDSTNVKNCSSFLSKIFT